MERGLGGALLVAVVPLWIGAGSIGPASTSGPIADDVQPVGTVRSTAPRSSIGDSYADTVVELRRGDRVVLRNLSGEVSVGTWERDALEVRGVGGEAELVVRRAGASLEVVEADRKGRRRSVRASVRVPRWVDVEAEGLSLDITVEGVEGRIRVSNVDGDVRIRDGGGPVEVRTVEGEVDVEGVTLGVTASSQSDDVRVYDAEGPISVHSGSGDVRLGAVRSASVRAETLDGDVTFEGGVSPGGDYRFFVHDGDAVVTIPGDAGARVSVSTFDGEFESDFPVRLERFTGGREFDFVIGDGSAVVQIQVFDGEIRLLRGR